MIRGWQHEADEKHRNNYMERGLFIQDKVQDYVELWGKWKNHTGYPFGDLRNKLVGDLWPVQYSKFGRNYCRRDEGKNLLTYLIYGLSSEADML
ncbi:unnamed protein product [Microthlaspi erraticum]|uniref:Uncharacterized protein n=1 Tax=Microthlaspi erraticum TaxID=1685480 RepID=A0A6D2K3N9_9BRAS|nr:unnamed protein product [Microthlaspi erraticum]